MGSPWAQAVGAGVGSERAGPGLGFDSGSCAFPLQRFRRGAAALHAHAPRPAPGHQNRRAVHHQSQVGVAGPCGPTALRAREGSCAGGSEAGSLSGGDAGAEAASSLPGESWCWEGVNPSRCVTQAGMAAPGWGSAVFLEADGVLVNPAAGAGGLASPPVFPASLRRERLLRHRALPGASSPSPSCAPVAPWHVAAMSRVGGCLFRAEVCLVWAAQTSPPRSAQGSIGVSPARGQGSGLTGRTPACRQARGCRRSWVRVV